MKVENKSHKKDDIVHLIQKHRSDRVVSDSRVNTNIVSLDEEEKEILGHTEIANSVVDEDLEIPVYGDVSLDEDEKNILRKPPKFATFGQVDLYTFFQEVQVANAKLRWHRKEHGDGEDEEQGDEEPDQEMEMLELYTRETYDPVNKVFDFRKKRTTDVKTNQRVYLPEPRPLREESELSVRNDIWEAEIRK